MLLVTVRSRLGGCQFEESNRNRARHGKPAGARCLARKDDRWHLQTLCAKAAPLPRHRRTYCQCQIFRFDPSFPRLISAYR
jgi:hypothetical protein